MEATYEKTRKCQIFSFSTLLPPSVVWESGCIIRVIENCYYVIHLSKISDWVKMS